MGSVLEPKTGAGGTVQDQQPFKSSSCLEPRPTPGTTTSLLGAYNLSEDFTKAPRDEKMLAERWALGAEPLASVSSQNEHLASREPCVL